MLIAVTKHLELINKFYSDIVYSLLQPSKDVLGSSCHHLSFHPIPCWNNSVKLAHIRARIFYLSWVKKGRPKYGEILTTRMKSTRRQFKHTRRMKSTRRQFKYELRLCKRLKDQKSADALAKAFHSNTSKAFWQNIKKLKKSCPLPAAVRGASGSQKIAEMWKNHFSNLLNSVESNEYKEFVYNNITCKNSYMNSSQYMCDVSIIQFLMCKLPFNSVVGSDGISAKHICFADSTVVLYLSLFFICVSYMAIFLNPALIQLLYLL